jgi:hypothetical protein
MRRENHRPIVLMMISEWRHMSANVNLLCSKERTKMEYESDSNVYEEGPLSFNHRVLLPFQLTELTEYVLHSYGRWK